MTDSDLIRFKLQLGLFSRVARSLGLERSHVRRVALGERRSARVQKALEAELARIDRAVARQVKSAKVAA